MRLFKMNGSSLWTLHKKLKIHKSAEPFSISLSHVHTHWVIAIDMADNFSNDAQAMHTKLCDHYLDMVCLYTFNGKHSLNKKHVSNF